MKPGSTDGVLTVLASLLVSAVLFIAQHLTSASRANQQPLPEDNLANASASSQAESEWTQQTNEPQTVGIPNSSGVSNPFDQPFGNAQAGPSTSSANRSGTGFAANDSRDQTNRENKPDTSKPSANQPTFKVVSIIDGDTVDVLVNLKPVRLRLSGIDTPEKGQPFGHTAKDELAKVIGGKHVQYIVRDTDRYNRSIADIYYQGVHMNKWLVKKGLAWHYKAYNKDPELAQAEKEASAAARGLWADPRRIAPWDWRKLSKVERDKYR